jgi:hypothetical protein
MGELDRHMPQAADTNDTDRIAHGEPGYLVANRSDAADDLVPRNAGVERPFPFAANLMQVRVADPTISDGDPDVVRARLATIDGRGGQQLVAGRRPVSGNCQLSLLD